MTENEALEDVKMTDEKIVVPKKKFKKESLIKHLYESYGNISNVLSLIDMLFKGENENTVYKTIKRYMPFALFGYDLGGRIKSFYKSQNRDVSDVSDDRDDRIKTILDIGEGKHYWSEGDNGCRMNSEILEWLLKSPKVSKFKILKYVELNENKVMSFVGSVDSFSEISILMEYQEKKVLINCSVSGGKGDSEFFKKKYCSFNDMCFEAYTDFQRFQFLKAIYLEYLETLNFRENVLSYDYDIKKRPRITDCDFDFQTLDFKKLKNEITTTLDNGERRGYILAGNPGTGKTSVLLRLEKEMTKYPILYVAPHNLQNDHTINILFSFLKTISPCVVVLEDMDSYSLSDKNERTGTLLSWIDNSKEPIEVVFIATINDSCKLNYSIVRPGRFDEIIDVEEPKVNNEIYNVMKTHYEKQKIKNTYYSDIPFIEEKKIKWFTFYRLKKYKFTQAEYCEIVQKIMLQKWEFSNATLIKSRDRLLASRQSIEKYKREGNETKC